MRHMIRLTEYTADEFQEIFHITDCLVQGEYAVSLRGKTIVLFFPQSSLRTRITFEKGIHLLGGQSILFPPETLDKKESLQDVAGYLNNWVDAAVIRHKNIAVLDELAQYAKFSTINAMTDRNHPCEMLSDLYALSKLRQSFHMDEYLFCGANGNIGLAWKEAADALNLSLTQCCPAGYEIPGVCVEHNLEKAILGKDIICTDSLPERYLYDFTDYQITEAVLARANPNALLNPCPPFYRDEEVSKGAISSKQFVGYEFKKHLLEIHQALLLFGLR